jgi:hypothetical protein
MAPRHPHKTIRVLSAGVLAVALLIVTAVQALAVAPTVTSISPASGPPGCVVTLLGTNFTNPQVSSVEFDGKVATFTVVSGTEIRATVPGGASTGPIEVTNADGTATTANFQVSDPGACAPTIGSFTPTSGPVGTSVTITGANLLGATAVTFAGESASFTAGSSTQIVATVPSGAVSGRIRVTTAVDTAISALNFRVTEIEPPTITSFEPTRGPVGTSVTIRGTGFTDVTAVSFRNVPAAFTIVNDRRINTTVPEGATSGRIRITDPAGTTRSDTNFTVTTTGAPVITSFQPTSGPVGTSVRINGTGFNNATAVTFAGIAASFTLVSGTRIDAVVPSGATTGRIRVTTPIGTGRSDRNFRVTTPLIAHERNVSLELHRHLVAMGTVGVPDGFAACRSRVSVRIQRAVGDRWRTLVTVMTRPDGSFRVHIADREGRYRARVNRFEPSMGHLCRGDASGVRRHRH